MKAINVYKNLSRNYRYSSSEIKMEYKAFFLLLIFLFDTFYPAVSANLSKIPPAYDIPVAENATDMVDLFTGDFNYSLPLMTVPGPNGESVDLTATYQGGIATTETSGMLGLGWSLNTGEITRQVIGAPDDFAGQAVANLRLGYNDLKNTFTYGPFWFNKINTASSYARTASWGGSGNYSTDNLVIESGINGTGNKGLDYLQIVSANNQGEKYFPKYFSKPTAPFAMPAYDRYFVSGNGISGRIQPYIFSKSLGNNKIGHPVLHSGSSPKSGIRLNNKVEFHFEGSKYENVYNLPNNTTTNRLKSGTYVKYYTNAEINLSSNLFSNSTYLGFLDYRVINTTRRPSADYDPNAMGGIEITNEDGFTYHYSLPVMVNSCVDKSFSGGVMELTHKPSYAISWKLTAITGPDYKDFNNNKIADLGDVGYWVQYKYGLWSDDFYESSILYGRQNKLSARLTANHKDDINFKTSSLSFNETRSNKYYLDYIRTPTHTAYFLKDIRLDEHSSELGQGLTKVNPSLKLSRIVLMKNENKALIEHNNNNWSTAGLNSKFLTGLLNNPKDYSLMHMNIYNSQKAWIDKASLRSIEFLQDYSLCKKYYSNINNSFGTVTTVNYDQMMTASQLVEFKKINSGSNIAYSSVNPANFTTTDLSNSGKLTLNQIRTYEDGAIELFNPYKFDYRQTTSSKNPDFDPLKKDIWGYYKSDHDRSDSNTGYPTCQSAVDMDAWSLSKITLPSGASIDVEYEADRYSIEGFEEIKIFNAVAFGNHGNDANQAIKRPHYIYPIASVDNTSVLPPVTAWENSDKGYIEASIFGANTAGLTCENRGAKLFYVIPRPVSCDKKVPVGAQSENVRDVPEFLTCWDGPCYSSNAYTRWPDMDNYCEYLSKITQPYNKQKWYGYELQSANWMFGGGIRVKSITFNELESSLSYKKEFEYFEGYCAAPPKPYILGLAGGDTFYTLWNNTFNYVPYVNLTSVGYSRVKTQNKNMFSETNGYTLTHFRNTKFVHNPLLIRPDKESTLTSNYCNDDGYTLETRSNTFTQLHPIQFKSQISYTLDVTFSDEECTELGLIDKIEKFANNQQTPIYVKTFRYNTYSISESYDVSYLNRIQKVGKTVKQPVFAGVTYPNGVYTENFTTVNTKCEDEETYNHNSKWVRCGKFLTGTTEILDNVTTTTTYEIDQSTTIQKGVTVTSETDGTSYATTQYAYQNPVHPLGLKYESESKLNKLHEPVIVRQYKGGSGVQSMSDYNLISESVSEYNLRSSIRDFDPVTSTTNPQGIYYINTNSSYQTKDLVAENYEGNIGTNTNGNATFNFPNNHRLTGAPSLFSKNGKVLESYGLNNRYSAVKMGYNNLYPLASISNARYYSFGFTSFEDTITVAPNVVHFGGEFTGGASRVAWGKAHTGNYVAGVNANSSGPNMVCRMFDLGRVYEAKVWVHRLSPSNSRLEITLKGQTTAQVPVNTTVTVDRSDPANILVGDWVLMKCRITVPANLLAQYSGSTQTPEMKITVKNLSTGPNIAYFDDLMFGPIDSPITGNVYDYRTGRLIASLDNENFASYFNYDAAGRITSSLKETKLYGVVKVMEKEYNNCRSTKNIYNTGGIPPARNN